MFLAGAFAQLSQNAANSGDAAKASSYGAAAASFVIIFTSIFGATWLTVPWLYPAEIFPLHVRSQGNAWGVVGWSIGNGWLTLLCPVMFESKFFALMTAQKRNCGKVLRCPNKVIIFLGIGATTLHIFGIANVISIPIVWAFYPETNQRTLEEMDYLFASPSPFVWEAEKEFARLKAEQPLVRDSLEQGKMSD